MRRIWSPTAGVHTPLQSGQVPSAAQSAGVGAAGPASAGRQAADSRMAIAASSPLDWRWGKGVNKLSDAPMNGGSIARSTTYYKYFHKTIW
jgi:hypothetical protein